MRVIFDHQCFQDQPRGGISRYVALLTAHMAGIDGVTIDGWAGLHQGSAPAGFYGKRLSPEWLVGRGRGRCIRAFNAVGFQAWAIPRRAEVYHATYYRVLRGPSGAARVVTVHDCAHERYPELGGDDVTLKRAAIAAADHIICVSEQTKADLVEFYGVDPERMTVVYHGHGMGGRSGGREQDVVAAVIAKPYVLYVGTRGHYKNFELVNRAFAQNEWLRAGYDLVCAGGEEWIERPAWVKCLPSPDDNLLSTVYAGATALVYPSRFEGFGLPLLEAMEAGCPVLTTRCGSIPEVAGDAAWYVDPDDVAGLADLIRKVSLDGDARRELIGRGQARLAVFSWEKCARETLAVYEKAIRVRRSRQDQSIP